MSVKWYRFKDNSKLCIDALQRGVRESAEDIAYAITNQAAQNVTSDQDLKRSISTQQNEGKQFKVLGAKSPKEYANFSVNVPINPLVKERGAYSKEFGAYAPWAMKKEMGDPAKGVVPEPFMRPAIDEQTAKAPDTVETNIKRYLDRHHPLKE